jgi:hypothetical protein
MEHNPRSGSLKTAAVLDSFRKENNLSFPCREALRPGPVDERVPRSGQLRHHHARALTGHSPRLSQCYGSGSESASN